MTDENMAVRGPLMAIKESRNHQYMITAPCAIVDLLVTASTYSGGFKNDIQLIQVYWLTLCTENKHRLLINRDKDKGL